MMDKESLEFLRDQAVNGAEKAIQVDDKGREFIVGDNVHHYTPNDMPEAIETSTLSSVVNFVKRVKDAGSRGQLLVQVVSPKQVIVKSALDEYGRRAEFMLAEPTFEGFRFDKWYDRESLNIALQSQFVPTDDRASLLKFIGNYKEATENTASDDGVMQTATVQTGAANVDTVKVPNPVLLAPYRTFTEVEQPQSEFIFRMQQGMQGGLFEADAGAWRSVAIESIKEYFNTAFVDLKPETVVVLG
ncbi:hypothetical protein [Levilactobacillus acidifarinae]|uniref:Phage protein n=1 Tax=Levilactobacillus acidifarinae DSM 19394 = JCM 15949 TaxID=1423715 RepID=A0A0R1LL47_9LACO|nr:hypothetical protein [Levilactobacillus acidifarinae]KRK94227.1 hypothetical protein FD25_GL000178 [Levilactobacillus acidifarinae DSM 19394]GEO70510.1 hypothetical protein LAC03_24200 [Levilactobacillus acidifarinae]